MKRGAAGQANERGGGNRAQRRGSKGFNVQEAGMGAEHPNSRADKAMQRRNRLLAKRRARRRGHLPDVVEEKPDLRDLDIPMENIAIDDEDKTLYLDISDRGYEPDELIDFMTEHFGNNHPDGKVNVMTDDEGNVTGVSWHKDDDEPEGVFPAPKHQIQMDVVNSDPVMLASKQVSGVTTLTDAILSSGGVQGWVPTLNPEILTIELINPEYSGVSVYATPEFHGPGTLALGVEYDGADGAQVVSGETVDFDADAPDALERWAFLVDQFIMRNFAQEPEGDTRIALTEEGRETLANLEALAKLEENLEPRRKSRVVERGYERNHKLVDLVKKRAGYACEVDGCAVELFIKPDGLPYVEVHHLIMMAEGGPDTMENMVCVCANHHRELHYGENREQLKKQLQDLRGE